MPKKKNLLIVIIATAIIVFCLIAGIYILRYRQKPVTQSLPSVITTPILTHSPCLQDNEKAVDSWGEFYGPKPKDQTEGRMFIAVRDKDTKETKYEFFIDDVERTAFSTEVHKCGVYVARMFNYDSKKLEYLPGFRAELWKYQYNGKGEKILTLRYKDEKGVDRFLWRSFFRIDYGDPENYLALFRSQYNDPFEDPDYAIVIKDLKTMEDVFEIKLRDLIEKYQIGPGDFDDSWSWSRGFGSGDFQKGCFHFQITNFEGEVFVFRVIRGTWQLIYCKKDAFSCPCTIP